MLPCTTFHSWDQWQVPLAWYCERLYITFLLRWLQAVHLSYPRFCWASCCPFAIYKAAEPLGSSSISLTLWFASFSIKCRLANIRQTRSVLHPRIQVSVNCSSKGHDALQLVKCNFCLPVSQGATWGKKNAGELFTSQWKLYTFTGVKIQRQQFQSLINSNTNSLKHQQKLS